MKVILLVTLMLSALAQAQAGVVCQGKIREVHNYNSNENLYILLDTTTHYVFLETRASIAMALTAFASGKKVRFYMSESNLASCSGGPGNSSWDNVTRVSGWFQVDD